MNLESDGKAAMADVVIVDSKLAPAPNKAGKPPASASAAGSSSSSSSSLPGAGADDAKRGVKRPAEAPLQLDATKKIKLQGGHGLHEGLQAMLAKARASRPPKQLQERREELRRWEEMEPAVGDPMSNPLLWWKQHAQEFPITARLARKWLAVPGSSAPCERLFSDAGNVFVAKRSSLHDETASQLILIGENIELAQALVAATGSQHHKDAMAAACPGGPKSVIHVMCLLSAEACSQAL